MNLKTVIILIGRCQRSTKIFLGGTMFEDSMIFKRMKARPVPEAAALNYEAKAALEH